MCLLIPSGFPIIFLVLGHYDFVNLMEMILLAFLCSAALEEWRKRKMERARRRELEKNGTFTSQA
jgi:hypothetical protein